MTFVAPVDQLHVYCLQRGIQHYNALCTLERQCSDLWSNGITIGFTSSWVAIASIWRDVRLPFGKLAS